MIATYLQTMFTPEDFAAGGEPTKYYHTLQIIINAAPLDSPPWRSFLTVSRPSAQLVLSGQILAYLTS